jgi:hypothetical protein
MPALSFSTTPSSGQPLLYQAASIAVAVESGHAAVQPAVVLTPRDALAGAERLEGLVLVEPHRCRNLPRIGNEHRAVLVGQHHCLFGRKFVRIAHGVIADVTSRRLRVQPFIDVALGATRASCEFLRTDRTGTRHGFVQAELVAKTDHHSAIRGGYVANGARDERFELCLIDNSGVHGLRSSW